MKKKILLALFIIAVSAYLFRRNAERSGDSKGFTEASEKLHQIYHACFAYRKAHQRFPDGSTSNEAFRQLFMEGLSAHEEFFHLSGSGAPNRRDADGVIGTPENGFKFAIEPGECDVWFVRGLDPVHDDTELPMIFAKVRDGTSIYMFGIKLDGFEKTFGMMEGGIAKETKDGDWVDILSKEYGIDPKNILAPEQKPEKD